MKAHILYMLLVSGFIVCSCKESANQQKEVNGKEEQEKGPERDPNAPIRTDSVYYHLRLEDSIVLATDIGFKFKNISPDTIYIVNCNGALAPVLERKTPAGGWKVHMMWAMNACLSPPIVIPPQTELADTFFIRGALPGHDAAPSFPDSVIDGEYRVTLGLLVWHYNMKHPNFGDTVPVRFRYSNSFYLDAPAAKP